MTKPAAAQQTGKSHQENWGTGLLNDSHGDTVSKKASAEYPRLFQNGMLEISLTHWNETIDLESIRTIMICFWRHIKTLEFSLVYPFYVTISSALMPFLWTQVLGSTTQCCLINLPCSFALTIPLTDTFMVAFILKLQVTTFMGSIDVIFPVFSLVLLQTTSQSFQ